MQRSSSSTAMKSGDARLTSTKPNLVKIEVVVVAVSAEVAIMAAIVMDAATTAAVLATNFLLLVFFRRLFYRKASGVRVWPGGFCLIENELHHLMVQTTAKENSMEK